jgi:hypothetical protein
MTVSSATTASMEPPMEAEYDSEHAVPLNNKPREHLKPRLLTARRQSLVPMGRMEHHDVLDVLGVTHHYEDAHPELAGDDEPHVSPHIIRMMVFVSWNAISQVPP